MSIGAGFGRLYRGETTVDYYSKRKPAFVVSGTFLVVSVVALIIGGLNLGIDFRGGVAWEAPVTATLSMDAVREVLEAKVFAKSWALLRNNALPLFPQLIHLEEKLNSTF